MVKNNKVFRYRIYPNHHQSIILNEWMETCRWLYNKVLDYRIHDYSIAVRNFSIYYNEYTYLFERLIHDQEFLKMRERWILTNKKKRSIFKKEKIKRELNTDEYNEIERELSRKKSFKYKESGIPHEFYPHGHPITNQGAGETSDYKYYEFLKRSAPDYIREKLNNIPAVVSQEILSRVEKAYRGFYSGGGFPKFKRKGEIDSLTWTNTTAFNIVDGSHIHLSKIEGNIKIVMHRPIIGKSKTCNISKSKTGKYFANITVEFEESVSIPVTCKIAAIDRNIKLNGENREFMVLYDGENTIPYFMPAFLRNLNKNLKHIQKRRSLCAKGSAEWNKLLLVENHIWEKIGNCKNNWIENVTTELSGKYDKIKVEKLDIQNITDKEKGKKKAAAKKTKSEENEELTHAKQIRRGFAEVSHGRFLTRLKDKIGESNVIEVNPAYTSMKCSSCGHIKVDLKLSDREWNCSICGVHHNRDSNAAINIYNS